MNQAFSPVTPAIGKTPAAGRTVAHTHFDAARIRAVLERAHALAGPDAGPLPDIDSYEDFARLVPAMDGAAYSALAEAVFARRTESAFYVGGSSGTTSKSKLVLAYTPRLGVGPSDEQRELITSLRQAGIFQPGDVVANGFLVGLFSILHHGMNRVLEACGASVVPLGSLDESCVESQLAFLADAGTNVLVGTPGTLVQVAHAVRRTGVRLDIRRIAFTGERLGATKLALLRSVFPGVRVISLYGISEAGFVAIGDEQAGTHKVRENAYFLETDTDGRLLLTCLDPANPIPIVRYMPGDRITLESVDGAAWIRHIERSNLDFNFMGNLVELRSIRAAIAQSTGSNDPLIDVVLRTEDDGRDRLAVRVYGVADAGLDQARQLVFALPELREAFEKNAGTVEVVAAALEEAVLSGRQKQRQILDYRT
jgi:indoleacetate--lysine synthetase